MRGATSGYGASASSFSDFNPRTPCGVRPARPSSRPQSSLRFQSTHPMRGATIDIISSAANGGISIHAPHAGCDIPVHLDGRRRADFNPRTPCGVRPDCGELTATGSPFQSTHPMRGATPLSRMAAISAAFQSTHPMRGATSPITCSVNVYIISIHAPHAGCDLLVSTGTPVNNGISIHAPHAGCDAGAAGAKHSCN